MKKQDLLDECILIVKRVQSSSHMNQADKSMLSKAILLLGILQDAISSEDQETQFMNREVIIHVITLIAEILCAVFFGG